MTHSFRLFKELIYCLTPKERILLRRRLEANIEYPDKNKSRDLLKIVLNSPELTKIDVENKLYGRTRSVAFSKLIERAIEKIDEVFIGFARDSISIYSEAPCNRCSTGERPVCGFPRSRQERAVRVPVQHAPQPGPRLPIMNRVEQAGARRARRSHPFSSRIEVRAPVTDDPAGPESGEWRSRAGGYCLARSN